MVSKSNVQDKNNTTYVKLKRSSESQLRKIRNVLHKNPHGPINHIIDDFSKNQINHCNKTVSGMMN